MDAVPEYDGAIERNPWLGAVPGHELVDRMGVSSLTAGRRKAVQDGRFGVFEVGEGQRALRRLLLP